MYSSIDAIDVVRLSFLGASLLVLIIYFIPDLNARFLDYGARAAKNPVEINKKSPKPATSLIIRLLDEAAAVKVPHSYFITFYATSVVLSFFWLAVLPIFHSRLADLSSIVDLDRPYTPFSRTQLACILMLAQGVRRLLECYTLPSSANSTMWIGHWIVGVGFYMGMSVAIWIEGIPGLIKHEFSIHDLEFVAPTLRSALCLFLFLFASGIQHDCHSYLASLKNRPGSKGQYQLPDFPAFRLTLTPHYLMECLIYLSLAVLTAPKGKWLNDTVTCALLFVVTNLGVTAVGTRKWYERKFGKEAIAGRWAMIPYVL